MTQQILTFIAHNYSNLWFVALATLGLGLALLAVGLYRR